MYGVRGRPSTWHFESERGAHHQTPPDAPAGRAARNAESQCNTDQIYQMYKRARLEWSSLPEVQSHLLKLKVQHMNTSYPLPLRSISDGATAFIREQTCAFCVGSHQEDTHDREHAHARAQGSSGSAVQRVRWRDPCGRVQRLLDPVRESPKPEPHAFFPGFQANSLRGV